MNNVNITEESLQKALDAAKKRLEDLEKRYDTAIEQYQYYLSKDIEIEKANIKVLEEKLKEIHQDKLKKLNEYDSYINRRNCQDETFYSLNNFEAFVLQALNVLHLENIHIFQYMDNDKKQLDHAIEIYNKMFYENLKNKIGIKVDYGKH